MYAIFGRRSCKNINQVTRKKLKFWGWKGLGQIDIWLTFHFKPNCSFSFLSGHLLSKTVPNNYMSHKKGFKFQILQNYQLVPEFYQPKSQKCNPSISSFLLGKEREIQVTKWQSFAPESAWKSFWISRSLTSALVASSYFPILQMSLKKKYPLGLAGLNASALLLHTLCLNWSKVRANCSRGRL